MKYPNDRWHVVPQNLRPRWQQTLLPEGYQPGTLLDLSAFQNPSRSNRSAELFVCNSSRMRRLARLKTPSGLLYSPFSRDQAREKGVSPRWPKTKLPTSSGSNDP